MPIEICTKQEIAEPLCAYLELGTGLLSEVLNVAGDTPYIKSRVNIWNNCIKLIARSETLTTIKISKFKKDLKKTLLKIQNAFNNVEWYPDLNFTLR